MHRQRLVWPVLQMGAGRFLYLMWTDYKKACSMIQACKDAAPTAAWWQA